VSTWYEPYVYQEAKTVAELRKLLRDAKNIGVAIHWDRDRDWLSRNLIISKACLAGAMKYERASDLTYARLDLDGWLWVGV
jgi:hypothetical protein